MSYRSHKTVEIKIFLHFLLVDAGSESGAGSRSIQIKQIQMRIQEAQKHTDPTDPNPDADPVPEHCSK
jgi:hypothetical protein